MLEKVVNIVKKTYDKIYNQKVVSILRKNENYLILKFTNEDIIIDHTIGNRYRLIFSDYVGTIDKFRDTFDNILGFATYCCDTSDFVDLSEELILKINKYYNKVNTDK